MAECDTCGSPLTMDGAVPAEARGAALHFGDAAPSQDAAFRVGDLYYDRQSKTLYGAESDAGDVSWTVIARLGDDPDLSGYLTADSLSAFLEERGCVTSQGLAAALSDFRSSIQNDIVSPWAQAVQRSVDDRLAALEAAVPFTETSARALFELSADAASSHASLAARIAALELEMPQGGLSSYVRTLSSSYVSSALSGYVSDAGLTAALAPYLTAAGAAATYLTRDAADARYLRLGLSPDFSTFVRQSALDSTVSGLISASSSATRAAVAALIPADSPFQRTGGFPEEGRDFTATWTRSQVNYGLGAAERFSGPVYTLHVSADVAKRPPDRGEPYVIEVPAASVLAALDSDGSGMDRVFAGHFEVPADPVPGQLYEWYRYELRIRLVVEFLNVGLIRQCPPVNMLFVLRNMPMGSSYTDVPTGVQRGGWRAWILDSGFADEQTNLIAPNGGSGGTVDSTSSNPSIRVALSLESVTVQTLDGGSGHGATAAIAPGSNVGAPGVSALQDVIAGSAESFIVVNLREIVPGTFAVGTEALSS